jgi:cell division protein FtsW
MRQAKKPVNNKQQLIVSLLSLPLLLSLVGLVFVFEASAVKSFTEVGDSFYYLKLQSMWIIIGLVVMMVVSYFDYHQFYYFSFPLMLVTIGLLFLVLIPGIGNSSGGARRWIDLGFTNLQPTELAKFSVIIYLSSWFIHRERKRFFSFLILLLLLMFLIFLKPDMGTAAITFLISLVIYFLAGNELHYLVMLVPVSVGAALFMVKISPYRFKRLLAFFDPSLDPLGITYHINQILISLSNGGFFGQGFGASRQKFMFLPEAHTDSIFAIIGEEIGFLGSLLLIVGFVIFVYKLFRVMQAAPDRFGQLLAGGIFAYFNLQILINLSGMVNLIPLTGVPLPFISYGGSNLLVCFAMMGIIINIAKKAKHNL